MKKFFSLVLALVMALSLTTAAWGATSVSDLAGLQDAIDAGETAITLTAPITISADTTIEADAPVVITSNVTGNYDAISVTGGTLTLGANVTITSTNGAVLWAEGGKIIVDGAVVNVTGGSYSAACAKGSGSTIELKSGSINQSGVDKVTVSIRGTGASLVMSGGAITSADSSALVAYEGGTATISGGEVKSTAATVKSAAFAYDGGQIVVNDGTLTAANSAALIAAKSVGTTGGKVTVNGGTVAGVKAHEIAGASATITGGNITGPVSAANDATMSVSGGTFSTDVSEYVTAGNVFVNGKVVKTTSAGNTTVVDAKTLSVIDALGAEVDVSGITSIVKVAATTNKTTVDGKTTTTVVPAWYQLSDGTTSATFVECDKTSAEFMFTFKGVGSVYVRGMAVPAAFDATPVTLYTAPLKATCEKVGQDNDVYVVIKDKYYATDSSVVPGAEQYALLSNGKMVVYYGEATAKDHDWANATVKVWDTKDYATAKTIKCDDCDSLINVYTVPGSFDGKTYKMIPAGVAAGYYYVAGTVTTTVPGTVVTPSTDKVTSAETFDAGIAMYVGMSVMAAAGSAVVIGKKKD